MIEHGHAVELDEMLQSGPPLAVTPVRPTGTVSSTSMGVPVATSLVPTEDTVKVYVIVSPTEKLLPLATLLSAKSIPVATGAAVGVEEA
ncbi:hypothetical protein KDH_48630 [Dictyobacter sp. S3.2.2.5]|uniref:Uncharacterized protein n=1 Tax=Dictyobacter halimunensis TaxID=3026934 RepID=A0ABQ6FUT6_9CHLR|nr:hypothetical protein KDH_48630 [Dictyobacter sp. S3.2.2.5]